MRKLPTLRPRAYRRVLGAAMLSFGGAFLGAVAGDAEPGADREIARIALDARLSRALARTGFTGRVGQGLEQRLGRDLDPKLVALGNDLFFDPVLGLHGDNACAGCHSPTRGFGDTQSIAIGIQSNRLVGPGRIGPRNQRRTPMVINNAFYPKLMWNGRFRSPSGSPFDNSEGFVFPAPEGTAKFPPGDSRFPHLLVAQAHIPPTEQIEVAGFTGAGGPFDDGLGHTVPPPDESGFRNEPIRRAVLELVNAVPAYRLAFAAAYPRIAQGDRITFTHLGQALAEFEFSLTFADAPIDRFARGEREAMSDAQKRGAILFFGRAGCVRCHAVAGSANEMFSDFENHVAGVPQLAPVFGVGTGNFQFPGPGGDEDFGLEDITGDGADRYRFRTSPLRNLALQPAFFHNGAYTRLGDAVRHHLDPAETAPGYDPEAAGVTPDLRKVGPIEPVLERLDPLLAEPVILSDAELADLLAFLSEGLLDPRAKPENLLGLIPAELPSGLPGLTFEGTGP